MSRDILRALVVVCLLAVPPLFADSEPYFDQAGREAEVSEVSPSRLAAGVRAYPAGVLRALLAVAEQPLLLRQLAEEPGLTERPEEIYPPIEPELQGAVRELQGAPEVPAVAAAYPEETAALRRLYAEAPEGMEARVAELRARYEGAEFAGAVAWQGLLEGSPAALDAYRELLTRFCEEQLQEYAAFPYVEVLEGEYYYACPPNELVMAYAQERGAPAALAEVLRRWWDEHAPERVDDRVLNDRAPFQVGRLGDSVAALPPDQRALMWRVPSEADDAAVGLVPVIMQPPADQPAEARLAFAVAEHARLWAPPVLSDEPGDEPVVLEPEGVEEVPVSPARVVVAEPVAVRSYEIHYGSGYPYYYCYPWTWPVIYASYPAYGIGYVRGTYFGYGPRAYVSYRGSRARVSFHLGGGAAVYYDCRVPRRVFRVTRDVHRRTTHRYGTRHYWRNYGAPYGDHGGYVDGRYVPPRRHYWRDYGASYGDHPGLADMRTRRVVRRQAVSRRIVTTGTPRVVRHPRLHVGPRSGGASRGPAIRRSTRPPGTTTRRQGIIRRPANTIRRSGNRVVRPGTIRVPRHGGTVRQGTGPSTPTRRPAVRPSNTRRSSGSAIRRGPSRTSRSHGALRPRGRRP